MPELNAGQPPPDHYYADNLIALIEGVRRQYGDMLTPEESEFGEGVVAMPAEAQRLLARLISRKGPLVRVDSLNFREIDDTEGALTHLVARGFACWCPEAPAADLARLLTRAELARCFEDVLAAGAASAVASAANGVSAAIRPADAERRPADADRRPADADRRPADADRRAEAPPRGANARKGEYLEWIERSLGDSEVHRRIEGSFPWVALDGGERLELYRLLFFGDRRRDLSTFVLRDLGLARYPEYELAREAAPVRRSRFARRLCRVARPRRSGRRAGLDAAGR